jgi:1,4-dihydroxy-2-naphthoate octaprenyltransferase
MYLKFWIEAARLRTLPLAFSSTLMGIMVSYRHHVLQWDVCVLAILTTFLLQVLSNFANDYGDGIKGTDKNRVGPIRAIQSGRITTAEMKRAIKITSILSFISGTTLILVSEVDAYFSFLFLFLGMIAIYAAIKYTVGSKAYGYYGFGDIFVFLFFGLLAVIGVFYLQSNYFSLDVLFPAITVGLLSTGVLNLNNMRDIENDKRMGKRTVAVILGITKAKLYHIFLINLSFFSLLVYLFLSKMEWYVYLVFLMYIPFILDLSKIEMEKTPRNLDLFLRKTAINTLLLTIFLAFLVFISEL